MAEDFYDPSDYEMFDLCVDRCRNCGADNSALYKNHRDNDYEMFKCLECGMNRFFNSKEQ